MATFFWMGPDTLITAVHDRLANNRPVGNTYRLVERVTNGSLLTATYVATNARGFPDPCCSPGQQDSIYVVEAFLASAVTEGGIMISAYTGVDTAFVTAVGEHRSSLGAASATTVVAPGAIAAGAPVLVYGVAVATPVVGHATPGPPFQQIGTGSSPMMEIDGEWAVQATEGLIDPQWTWFFRSDAPGSWLATVVALNPESGPQPVPPPTATRLAFTGQPGNVTAASAIAPAVRVTAQDDAGNPVTGFTGTITVGLGANPGGGTLSGATSVAAVRAAPC